MSTKRQVGTAIFVLDSTRSKVWLHRRETARDYNGCYALAGGGVDAGEKARKAAARELTEETGLVKPASSFAFLKRTHEEKSPTDKWSTVWYVIILAPEERPKKTESLAGDWDLFEIAALANHPTPLYPGIVEMVPVLEKYLRSLPPTNIAAHYPCALATVDIAVTRSHNGTQEILLGRKKNATKWRFPGGFVDPQQDPDFIHAAYRECPRKFWAASCPKILKFCIPAFAWMNRGMHRTRTVFIPRYSSFSSPARRSGSPKVEMIFLK